MDHITPNQLVAIVELKGFSANQPIECCTLFRAKMDEIGIEENPDGSLRIADCKMKAGE